MRKDERMKKCAVIGSINMDMVIRTPRYPAAGETLTGIGFSTVPGGKGANQAIALAKLGVPVCMAGMVGDDSFGQAYMDHFRATGVDCSAVTVKSGATTGVANILVNDEGENCIIVVPGANGECDEAWLDSELEKIMHCDIFLLQLEIPLDTVKKCVEKLRKAGKTIILDPAPAVPLDDELLSQVDYVTPNATELRIITPALPEDAGVEERVRHLIGDSDRMVIHKNGADGAYIAQKDSIEHVPGYKVKAVDTTAAGDTFNAGFAAGLAMGLSTRESVQLANAAGAMAVTKLGAQGGMPTMEQAKALMEQA